MNHKPVEGSQASAVILGATGKLAIVQKGKDLEIALPVKLPGQYAYAIKLE